MFMIYEVGAHTILSDTLLTYLSDEKNKYYFQGVNLKI